MSRSMSQFTAPSSNRFKLSIPPVLVDSMYVTLHRNKLWNLFFIEPHCYENCMMTPPIGLPDANRCEPQSLL